MSTPENFVSKTLLKSFVPLGALTSEQLDLLIASANVSPYFQGQKVTKIGDSVLEHIYLLHGSVMVEDALGKQSIIEAGDRLSHQVIAHEFPRRVTVIAKNDCSILKIDSSFLEKLLCWGQVSRCLLAELAVDKAYQDDFFWIKRLLESKLFYKVPPSNIRSVLDKFTEQKVVAGEQIIKEGDEGSCCYLIKSGSAEVLKKQGDSDTVLTEIGQGAVFGEDALVTQKPRNASIVMKNHGVLMKLEKQDFLQLLKQPAVTMVTTGNLDRFIEAEAILLDVRTEQEYDLGHHQKALNLPLNLAYLKSSLLDKEKTYITYASHVERAKAAASLLIEQGFTAYALQVGTDALPQKMAELFSVTDQYKS